MNSVIRHPALTRRDYLSENTRSRSPHIRPPWALREDLFREKCIQCNNCIKACPEKIIFRDDNGYPTVKFSASGCTFCAECLENCQHGALRGLRSDIEQAWSHCMRLSDRCLAFSGVACHACSDHCEANAIGFSSLNEAAKKPEIYSRSCTGCGKCIAACPTHAISADQIITRLADVRI